jgi:hypothetical protein
MDNFYEQLEKSKESTTYKIANSGTYIVGVLGLLIISSGGVPGLILGVILLAAAVGLFFLKKNLYVEYEYNFTNGEIDVDKIFEMKSRKRAISFAVKDLELLAPENSTYVKDFGNKPDKVLNLYPKDTDKKVYVGMVTGGPERAQIRFVPSEQLLELCYKYNPRAIKKEM